MRRWEVVVTDSRGEERARFGYFFRRAAEQEAEQLNAWARAEAEAIKAMVGQEHAALLSDTLYLCHVVRAR